MKKFLERLISIKKEMIAYEYDYFGELLTDRIKIYDAFNVLEKIISETINKMCGYNYLKEYLCSSLESYPLESVINVLNITNKLKCLIKSNINLNLLIDRYIIEITEEFGLCKK